MALHIGKSFRFDNWSSTSSGSMIVPRIMHAILRAWPDKRSTVLLIAFSRLRTCCGLAAEGTTIAEVVTGATAFDKLYITGNADAEIPLGPLKLHGHFDGTYLGSLLNDTHSVDLKVELGTELDLATFQYRSQFNGSPSFEAPQFHQFEVGLPLKNREARSILISAVPVNSS
jgi:hypothetical protein